MTQRTALDLLRRRLTAIEAGDHNAARHALVELRGAGYDACDWPAASVLLGPCQLTETYRSLSWPLGVVKRPAAYSLRSPRVAARDDVILDILRAERHRHVPATELAARLGMRCLSPVKVAVHRLQERYEIVSVRGLGYRYVGARA